MELVTLTFDRVFELRAFAGYLRSGTEFSFQAGVLKRYAVTVPGRPAVEAGMTVTALLRRAGDWQSLQGWRNWSNGEVAFRSYRATAAFAMLFLAFAALFLYTAFGPVELDTAASSIAGSIFGLCGLLMWRNFFFERKIARVLRGLSTPHLPSAAT